MIDPRAAALARSLSHLLPVVRRIVIGRTTPPRRRPDEDDAAPLPVKPGDGPGPLSGGAARAIAD